MRKIALILFFSTCILSTSCNDHDEINKESQNCLNVEFESKSDTIYFGSNKASQSITTKTQHWVLSGFYDENYKEVKPIEYTSEFITSSFVYEWVTVKRTGEKQISLSVDDNTTNKQRSLKVGINSGDCWNYVTLIQEE